VRYQYLEPNEKPVAVPLLSLKDELMDESEGSDYLEVELDASGSVDVWFHTNFSYDPNESDDIVKFQWDLDRDGNFAETDADEGYGNGSCPLHFSRTYEQAGDYYYDFMCTDGETSSSIVTVHLKIIKPEERPDLTITGSIDIETKDGKDEFHKQDTIVLTYTVKNVGNKYLEEDLAVRVYAAYRATQEDEWGAWEDISEDDIIVTFTEDKPLEDGKTWTDTFEWFTGDDDVDVGYYKFRLELDPEDDIEEYLEDKDQDETNMKETGEIFLDEEEEPPGDPVLSLKDFVVPERVQVLDLVTILVTVDNDGEGDGYVRVLLLVDGGIEARTKRFTVEGKEDENDPPNSEEVEINWRPQSEGTFTLKAELDYKSDIVAWTDETIIEVTPKITDEDGDGLPDWWEEFYFGNTEDEDGSGDPDEDDYTNLQEFYGHDGIDDPANLDYTDPTDKNDYPGKTGDDDDENNGGSISGFMLPLVGAALVSAAVLFRRRE